jgi:hypothetical protein
MKGREDFFGQTGQVSDGQEPDVVIEHLLEFSIQVVLEEDHERFYFFPGAAPVFRRKGKKGEIGNTDLPGRSDDSPDRFGPLLMAGYPVQRASGSPPSVPVHNDSQMPGEFFFNETKHNFK